MPSSIYNLGMYAHASPRSSLYDRASLRCGAGAQWVLAGAQVHQTWHCRHALGGTQCGAHRTWQQQSYQHTCNHTPYSKNECQPTFPLKSLRGRRLQPAASHCAIAPTGFPLGPPTALQLYCLLVSKAVASLLLSAVQCCSLHSHDEISH